VREIKAEKAKIMSEHRETTEYSEQISLSELYESRQINIKN
jgi:hypothetical protein